MKLRHVLAAASAAALLAGSSYGALAGSWSQSKSGTVVVSHADKHGSTVFLITGGDAEAEGKQAAAGYGSTGGGLAGQFTYKSEEKSKEEKKDDKKEEKKESSSKTEVSGSFAAASGSSSGCASVGKSSC